MAEPPASPPSSDIKGTDRDRDKLLARRKAPEPDQQEKLAGPAVHNKARPAYDPDIEPKGNAQ